MNVETVREYCLNKKGVTESFPFDDVSLVVKVMNKMFALIDLEEANHIALKCDPEKAIELREHYSGIEGAYHFNKNIKEIETNYELELAKINNEHELKVRQMDLIEKLIGEIDSIKVEIKIYQSKEGLTSSAVMELFNQIHNEKLTYMNKLISLGQK